MRLIGPVALLFLLSGCIKQVLKDSVPKSDMAIVALQEENKTFFCNPVEIEASTDYSYWTTYLQKAFEKDSSLSSLPAGRYTVKVNFVIDRDGSIKDVSVLNDPGLGLAEKTTALIKAYDGTWIPATRNGRNCSSCRSQPVTFVIEED